jgi:SAM-dependent methyltransferase
MTSQLETLTRPLPTWSPKGLRYAIARFLLGTVGRLSTGIRIGHQHGFDSGVMLDYVYDNRAHGTTFAGRLIDRVYLDAPGWTGIRNRGALIRSVIVEHAQEIARTKESVVVVDLACGGGRYVLAALSELKRRGVMVQATLRDYRPENVLKARANATALDVDPIVESGDAFSEADLAGLQTADLVIVSGLHEIVDDDRLVRQHFRQIAGLLARGGRLILTVQPQHPQLEFIARVLTTHTGRPWAMRLRSVELVCAWAREAGLSVESVAMEELGIFGVLVARKA